MHYGVSVGRHICVEFVYQEATARLAAVRLLLFQPPAPPAPEPSSHSLEDVVQQFEEELFLGDTGNEEEEEC
jgi:hypothetical protein